MLRQVRHQFRRTTLVAVFCAALVSGIGLACAYQLDWLAAAVLFFSWLLNKRRRNWLGLLLIVALGIALGDWRGSLYVHKRAEYQQLYNHKITIIGKAAEDAVYAQQTQLAFDLQNVRTVSGTALPGKLGIKGFGANAVFHGDMVTVTGKLRPGKGSYEGWISYAQLTVRSQPASIVDRLRRRFYAGMQSTLPEPTASFGLGLLIGQRNTLPDSVTSDLKHVGLTHIIAVSGYNLTIILMASRRLLGKRSKYQFTVMSLACIGSFLLLTGNSPSIVRAAIVSTLSLGAWYYGRSFRPTVLILLAAAMTGYANPLYVWSDAGWYLSFLAFAGVMLVAPLIQARFIPSKRLRDSIVVAVALESFCAELVTLPYVLHTFGQMSLVGLPANVLVAAFVPLAMLLSFVAGIAGMAVPMIGGWIAWPAQVVLTYMLDVAHVLAGLPRVFIQNRYLSIGGLVAAYVIIMFLVWVLAFKSKANHAIITDENQRKSLEKERVFSNERTQQVVNY